MQRITLSEISNYITETTWTSVEMLQLLLIVYACVKNQELSFDDDDRISYSGDDRIILSFIDRMPRSADGSVKFHRTRAFHNLLHLGFHHIRSYDYVVDRIVSSAPSANSIKCRLQRHFAKGCAYFMNKVHPQDVFEFNSGAGDICRAYQGQKRMKYACFERDYDLMDISRLLNAISDGEEPYISSSDRWNLYRSEMVIGTFIPEDRSDESFVKCMGEYDRFVSRLLDSDKWKHTIILTDARLCTDPRYVKTREFLCNAGLRTVVIGNLSTYGEVVKLRLSRDVDHTGTIVGSYQYSNDLAELRLSEIQANSYALYPEMYVCHPNREGMEALFPEDASEMTFGELVEEIEDGTKDFYFKASTENSDGTQNTSYVLECNECIDVNDFSCTPFEAACPKTTRLFPENRPFRSWRKVHGPCLCLNYSWSNGPACGVCIVDEDTEFLIFNNTVVLKLKENVDARYAALLLLSYGPLAFRFNWISDAARNYVNHPRRYWIDFNGYTKYLLDCRVPIVKGRQRQTEVVDQILARLKKSSQPGNEFTILTIGRPFSPDELDMLTAKGIHVMADVAVEGSGSAEEILAEDSMKANKSIHAVVINPEKDYDPDGRYRHYSMNYLCSFLLHKFGDVPFFAWSSKGIDSLNDVFPKLLDPFREPGRFGVSGTQEAFEAFADGIKNTMEYYFGADSNIKSRYSSVLEAAELIDSVGNLSNMFVEAVKVDFSKEASIHHTENKFNELRINAEKILRHGQIKGLLPPLRLGAFAQLMCDHLYVDNSERNTPPKAYRTVDGAMPYALAFALKFFTDIANGGSHNAGEGNIDVKGYVASTGSANLYRSCVFILMDVLLWYVSLFQDRNEPVFECFSSLEPGDRVKKIDLPDGKQYWYIGHTHLIYKKGLYEGCRAVIRMAAQEKNPVLPEIYLYSKDYDIYNICNHPSTKG